MYNTNNNIYSQILISQIQWVQEESLRYKLKIGDEEVKMQKETVTGIYNSLWHIHRIWDNNIQDITVPP